MLIRQFVRMKFLFVPIVVSISFILSLAINVRYLLNGQQDTQTSISAILISLAILTLIWVVIPGMMYWAIKRQFDNNRLGQNRIYGLANDLGITVTTPQSQGRVNWPLFSDIEEDKNYFYSILKNNKQVCQVIPKRAFLSNEDLLAFRELIAEKKKSKVISQNSTRSVLWIFLLVFLLTFIYVLLALARMP